MRRLIVTNIVSLDACYEGPDEDVMVMPMDHAFDAYNVERLRQADTLVLGRRSYDLFRGFWPAMADNPEASPDNRELATLENAIDKVVVSDTLTEEETAPWRDTTRIVPRAVAREHVAELKRAAGRDILIFASRVLWNDLLAAGLIDEIHLIVGAVVLGGGTPAFRTPPGNGLRLLETRAFDGSQNALLRYAVAR